MAFEQATIKVEKQQEFAKLQAAVEQVFLPERVERFLKQLDRKGIRVREFDAVLSARTLENAVGGSAAKSDLQCVAVVSGVATFRSGADARVLSVEAGNSSTSRCGTSSRSCISITEE